MKYVGKDLASRLLSRFGLMDSVNRPAWALGEIVHPVTLADELVRIPKIYAANSTGQFPVVSTAAGGWLVAMTVPQGKRWKLFNFHVYRGAGTINTVDKVAIHDMIRRMEVKGFTASSNYQSELVHKHSMEAGWRFEIECATGEAASTFGVSIEVEEEDAD